VALGFLVIAALHIWFRDNINGHIFSNGYRD